MGRSQTRVRNETRILRDGERTVGSILQFLTGGYYATWWAPEGMAFHAPSREAAARLLRMLDAVAMSGGDTAVAMAAIARLVED